MGRLYRFSRNLVFWGAVFGALAAGFVYLVLRVGQAYFSPEAPPPSYAQPATQGEANRQDLDYAKHFLAFDRSFTPEAKRKAEAIRQDLIARADALSKADLALGLSRMAALADNGHSNALPARRAAFGFVPFRLTRFDDGLYITRARREVPEIVGARIAGIEGHPIADVLEAFKPLFGGTPEYRDAYSLYILEVPALLHAMGFAKSQDEAGYDLVFPDGRSERREIAARPVNDREPVQSPLEALLPVAQEAEAGEWVTLLEPLKPLPLWLSDGSHALRSVPLEKEGGHYLQLRANDDVGAESMALFTKNVKREIKESSPKFVVVDMRFNGGGDYTTTADLMRSLPKMLPEARFYVLTSNETFSAGITSIVFLEGAAPERTMILGEMAGDRANMWAEGNRMILPNSKLRLRYSTGFHSYDGHCGKPNNCFWLNYIFRPYAKSYAPDERIPLTYADFLAGRDAVMERVLALEAARAPDQPEGRQRKPGLSGGVAGVRSMPVTRAEGGPSPAPTTNSSTAVSAPEINASTVPSD